MYDWAGYLAEDAQARNGPVLVIVPAKYVWQLTGSPLLTSDVIGSNGRVALVAVRAR
jgi:hypothetical protein